MTFTFWQQRKYCLYSQSLRADCPHIINEISQNYQEHNMQNNPQYTTDNPFKTYSNPLIPTYYPPNITHSRHALFDPNPVLSLPQSVLSQPDSQKKASQNIKIVQKQRCRLDQVSQASIYYQSFLRKTVLNQTKQKWKIKQRHQSLNQQKKVHSTIVLQNVKDKSKQKVKSSINNRTAYDTLKLLQKVIIKEKNLKPSSRNLNIDIEIQANKLPLIQKEVGKKQRVLPNYDPKYKWEPQQYPTRQDIQKMALKYRKKVEKPEIRGWDQNISIDFD